MSQFFVGVTAGSLPPIVPTSFGVDLDISSNPPGLVTPSNNKVYVLGANGIETQASTTDAANDTIKVEFVSGTTITSDGAGQTQTVLTFTTITNSTFTLQAMIAAYEISSGSSFGGRLLIVGKNVAGAVSVVSEIENISGSDAALLPPTTATACSFTASGVGATLIITVKGIAGHTIDWTCITPGFVRAS